MGKIEKNEGKKKFCQTGKKYLTEAGFEPAPEDQCLKLAP
jgi:hypothetical protein